MSNWYIIPSKEDLQHHGIKGQKWGVKNGPPYPLDQQVKGTSNINLDKWGKDKNHNILYVTGLSGSGKSTIAEKLKNSSIDVINLDLFLEENDSRNERNKNFVSYLNTHYPNFDEISRRDVKTGTKEFGNALDRFESCIDGFGREQYSKSRNVIVEGVQLLDDTLYPDKNVLKDKPIITPNTSPLRSMIRGMRRDEISIDVADLKERINWYKQSNKNLKQFKKTVGL